MRPTNLGSWERCIGHAAKNYRSFSQPRPPRPGWQWYIHPFWVDVPLLVAHAQLLANKDKSLGNYRWDKLQSTLCGSYWWPGMHADIANCIWCCLVCQWDKLPAPPKEELCWTDKGGAPFIGWSIDIVDPFPWGEDRNCYLLVAVDPFFKWVETHTMPLLHSWRVAKFLCNDLVPHWGKPHYVQTDNSSKFVGSFAQLCKRLGIIHHHITIGNRKASGHIEWMIRIFKDCIQRGLTKDPATFWMKHLALAMLLLHMTASRMMGITLFLLAMVYQPMLPSMAVPGLPSLPNQLIQDGEEAYLTKVSRIVA